MTVAAPAKPRPEILAPAGNEEMMRAAVENGADAVYFGLEQFNARMRATNFPPEELPRLMAWLHERGVKGYITMNTLLFTRELEEGARMLAACATAGVDAVLVQDIGVALLANRLAPALDIHASTQMSITSAEGARAIERLGVQFSRLVAAREMNRREIGRLVAGTTKEVEVFVHGAICVAYSGQCLTSEALGGRSANRGQCAQACRLPYDLIVDGAPRDLGEAKYLLSPMDLAAWEDTADLIDAGVVSLKIEGRYKTPQYVAATVQAYRAAVEQAAAATGPLAMPDPVRERLEMTFSRGLTGGYLHETNHQAVVDGRSSKKRGPVLGTIVAVGRNEVEIEARIGLRVGDGIAFADERDPDHEEGGRIYEIFAGRESIKEWRPAVPGRTRRLTLRFARGGVRFGRLYTGQTVHKTSDQRLDAELRASYEGDRIHSHRPVWAVVSGRVGAPLRLELRDAQGLAVNVEDTAPAEPARTAPLGHEVLTRQIGRLGNTPFELAGLECRLEGDLMVPASRLNELRRRAVEELLARRRALLIGRPVDHAALPALRAEVAAAAAATPPQPAAPRLSVLCRTLPQVEAAVAAGCIDTVYTDFEDIRLHREAATILRGTGVTFAPATIRIVKPGDAPFVRMLLKSEPDAILLRNLAAWEILREAGATCAMRGDFSLNIANELAAWAHHRRGITMLTPSYDLNIDQLLDMVGAATPSWFEVTIHQYMPMFHMEHCVFCRFMSEGTDYTNCGRPCEKHTVALRDRVGVDHPVKADAGCRNTVFNGVAQSASEYLDALLGAGLRRFRVDLLDEDTPGTARVITAYRDVLAGRASGRELWRQLRATSKLGVTKGSLDHE